MLGNVIAGSGDKTLGTVIGGAAGAILGNKITKPGNDCDHAYGYYDTSGAWHANDVRGNNATGYFDRDSRWVDGAPQGRYDANNQWVAFNGNNQNGYRDQQGNWVPGNTNGYYDSNGRYINVAAPQGNAYNQRDGMVSGYYNNGRWVAGQTSGRYDANGRWISRAPAGRRDNSGNWVWDPQPGYYDQYGRWNRGEVRGSYDDRGRWVVAANGYGQNGYGQNANLDTAARLDRIEQRVNRGIQDRSLDRREATRATSEIASIRRYDRSLRNRNGAITPRNAALVDARIDNLARQLRLDRNDDGRGYGRNG